MRITLGAIKEIITDYNKRLNRYLDITPEITHEIQELVESNFQGEKPVEEYVEDMYEDILADCEHKEYDVCDDEDDVYDGQGDYIKSVKYQYVVCRICGKTAAIRTIETEDGFEQEVGDWNE